MGPPSAEAIAKQLGTESPAYFQGFALLEAEWRNVRGDHQAAYAEWEKSIIHVYGSNLATPALFLRHTYITTVAKVLMAAAIVPDQVVGKNSSESDLRGIIYGDLFRRFGILNIGERDFFAWVAETKGGLDLTKGLLLECAAWDFHRTQDDLLRNLYEQLIDPETRHDLGELYTPPWLARLLVEESLESPSLTILDPACGSGTFLVAAIVRKIGQGRGLDEILKEVAGIDIHPVAVSVARASYLLAVRSLLRGRPRGTSQFSIPVFLADSITPTTARFRSVLETGGRIKYYELTVRDEKDKERQLAIPAAALEGEGSEGLLDAVEKAIRDGSWASIESVVKAEFDRVAPQTAQASLGLLEIAFKAIQRLHTHKRDGIHVFLLRNYFRPTTIEHSFDRIVGNPPWLAFRYLKDSTFQRFVKTAYAEECLMPVGETSHLITQIDLGPLFFARTAKRFLRPGGKIRFLLPRTVFNSNQYSGFRGTARDLAFDKVWDFARVGPIFSVNCCAVGADLERGSRSMRDPIPTQRWVGRLSARLAPLGVARIELAVEATTMIPTGDLYNWTYPEQDVSMLGFGNSPYHSEVENGATIYPYPLTMVDIDPDPVLGLDLRNPPVKTGARALRQAKPPWNAVALKGNVESRFLFNTITGSEVLPFGHLPLPVAALPLVSDPHKRSKNVLDSRELATAGERNMAQFFSQAENCWSRVHKGTGKKGTGSCRDQIDFRHKLSRHPLKTGYFVVIPGSARLVLACVLPQGEGRIQVAESSIPTQATIVDGTNNYLFTADADEAHYLCAILNSGPVNATIKAPVHKGLDTERHTYREPLTLPIPRFNRLDPSHARLAALGSACDESVVLLLGSRLSELAARAHVPASLSKLRMAIRGELKDYFREIDQLTIRIFETTTADRRGKQPIEAVEPYESKLERGSLRTERARGGKPASTREVRSKTRAS